MPATTSCTPCCAETQTVNVPGVEGPAGTDGANGVNGENASTITTADFAVPNVGNSVVVDVQDSGWMVVGQIVITDGPANFVVASIPNSISVQLTFLGYAGDVAPATNVATGARVSPSGLAQELTDASAYAAGTAYSLTATSAALVFGTTSPDLVIPSAGTWLIFASVRFDYTGATFAASRTVSTKLRRSNNTATDLTNGTSGWLTEIITTLTYTAIDDVIGPVTYTTANANDSISIFVDVSVIPTAGTLDAVEANIVAIRISN
jgi:hypothetical protein